MGERGRNLLRGCLIVLAVTGALGYGVTFIASKNIGVQEEKETAVSKETAAGLETEGAEPDSAVLSASEKEETAKQETAVWAAAEIMETENTVGKMPAEKSGEKEFYYVGNGTSFSGISEETAEAVRRINKGELLSQILEREQLEGFYALIGTQGIKVRDSATGKDVSEGGQVILYVPNLIEGLEKVSVLFYDLSGEQWDIISPEQTDPQAKTVTAKLPGPGILTVIYKRGEEGM